MHSGASWGCRALRYLLLLLLQQEHQQQGKASTAAKETLQPGTQPDTTNGPHQERPGRGPF